MRWNLKTRLSSIGPLYLLMLAPSLQAQTLSYPGCSDITAADFKKVPLVTRAAHSIAEPIEMAMDKSGRIFWVELAGKVRMWSPTTRLATDLAVLPTFYAAEYGVVGLELDPGFDTNGWMYVFWAVNSVKTLRLSRFTLKGAALDMATEKNLLEIPLDNLGCCHTGGHMTFDLNGHLWLSVGNMTSNGSGTKVMYDRLKSTNYVNESAPIGDDQRGAANTNSLLGKILRIKPKPLADNQPAPTPGPGRTYDIPPGNLFPVGEFPAGKTRPEIYTMGHRNPYSIAVDPYRNWLMWGDIGPDEFIGETPDVNTGERVFTEEHNLVTRPGFMGWPYFVGNNQYYRLKGKDPQKPLNNSINNTGLVELPPAQPAIRPFPKASAITGPIYYYNGKNPSTTKLPPHFQKKWIIGNYGTGWIYVATVDSLGTRIEKEVEFWKSGFLAKPLDLYVGPDDNLYAVEYAGFHSVSSETAISRIEYTGSCLPATPLLPDKPTAMLPGRNAPRKAYATEFVVGADASGAPTKVNPPADSREVRVFDSNGALKWTARRTMQWNRALEIPTGRWTPGIYFIKYL